VLAGKLWYVQVVQGAYYQAQGNNSKIRLEPVPALRGIIFDRKGHQLVYNAPDWDVTVVPHGVPSSGASKIYQRLSKLLHGHPSAKGIAAVVRNNMWHQYAPSIVKQDVRFSTAMDVLQLHSQLPGFRADPSSLRQYPTADPQFSLSHILGYTGTIAPKQYTLARRLYGDENYMVTDQTGEDGIEASLEPYLHGVNGTERVEVDAGERPIRVLNPGRPVPGDSVYLTINWKLQQEVSRDLEAGLAKLGLRRGVAIIENVHNGQILSMVSLPGYNDNLFAHGIKTKQFDALLKDPAAPLLNQAIAGVFPPGSIYKVITASAALQSGKITPAYTVDDTGSIDIYGKVFNGWKAGGLGTMNIVSALAMSSDIYFYTVVGGNPNITPDPAHIGAAYLGKYARLYGLGSPTGIDLPGEAGGLVPTPSWFDHLKPGPLKSPGDAWYIGDNYNSAIGQGFDDVTPLQMVNVAATIANGGTLYRPRIVKQIDGRLLPSGKILRRSQVVQPFVPDPIRSGFVSASNLALIQEGMHDSVTNSWNTGTSKNVYDPRINAAGKTGTAEAPGGPHAWWLGYAPYNNPQVAIAVLVPNANAEGAYVSAPIAHKLLEDYFHLPPHPTDWLSTVQQLLVGQSASQ
ncbi:MAG: penicillin-binding protein 2, partial [Chloroflexota bacterium]